MKYGKGSYATSMRTLAIIPIYNEEESIASTIQSVRGYVDEIVVVNDGSTDNSVQVALNEGVKVISIKPNRGKGMALYVGAEYFKKSDFDIMFTIDGDGQHNPEHIEKFIKIFEKNPECGMVIASRFGTIDWVENMPFLRKISNLLSRFGLWILYGGYRIEDPQNGFRAFRKSAAMKLDFSPQDMQKRFGFEAETMILIEARVTGVKVCHVHIPSLYFDDRVSKFSLLMDTWTIPVAMIKYFFIKKPWLYRRRFKN